MSADEASLAADRATRDAARAVFDERLARVRTALAERSVGQRVTHEVVSRAREAASESAAVARDNRWIVAAVVAALVAWFARRPLLRAGSALIGYVRPREPASRWQRLRNWTTKRINR